MTTPAEVIARTLHNNPHHRDGHKVLSALASAGYAVVPVVPTDAMRCCLMNFKPNSQLDELDVDMADECWRDTLAAIHAHDDQGEKEG